jgi:hypothetical protein
MKIQKMKYIKIFIAVLISSISSHVFAATSPITSCNGRDSGNHDYSDAPGTYGVACNNSSGRWQALGPNGSGTDTSPAGTNAGSSLNDGYKLTTAAKTWTAESGVNSGIDGDMTTIDGVAVDTDDGVHWRTSSDGGLTWGTYGNGDITQGDTVEYRFGVARSTDGTHEYDRLKVWADWNKNEVFDNDASEILYEKDWALHEDSNGNATDAQSNASLNNGRRNTDLSNVAGHDVYNSSQYYSYFTQQVIIPIDALTGDTWLRARIVCENAITERHGYGSSTMLATGYYNQGETEDYKIKIIAKVVNVPEPSTLLVFAIGLIGITAARKKLKIS